MDITSIISFLIGLSILISVILLIRGSKLKERYSILWLFSSIIVCMLALSRGLLERLSHFVGIYYAPSFLFLVGVLFLLAINISFSVTISRLSSQINILAQRIAMLESKKEEKL